MRWKFLPDPDADHLRQIAESLNVSNLIARLLVQRGITTFEQARSFFRPSLEDLHNPFLMRDMDRAVNRISKAIIEEENILVFGDYDVDGTTAVSLMATYLRQFNPNVATYIPDRYTEGYGVSYAGIDFARDNDISLIIALDCGVKSIEHVAYAAGLGIDFIICDHHLPGAELPAAVAVLDPKRPDCAYPYDELCGCGVGFKLIQALQQRQGLPFSDLVPYLDLVATAIAADIVPITGENRVLAHFGLQQVNLRQRPGLSALLLSLKKRNYDISDLVFTAAPRINAAGRIRHGQHAVSLLCEADAAMADGFAREIEEYNKDRRELDQRITEEALQQILAKEETDRFSTVVFQDDWHKGVIGIVASRLIETYYRPTLVFTKSEGKLAASARSVIGFDVHAALESCSAHLIQFGGHKYAAGLTMAESEYENFKSAFEEIVKTTIAEESREPEITVDATIRLEDIDDKTIRILKQFEPFGPGNRTPVFFASELTDTGYAKAIGRNEDHLRMYVKQGNSASIPAVGFGLGDQLGRVKDKQVFEALFCIDENEWNGKVSTQLRIKDIR